jgi:hypothetical protein
MDNVHSPIIFLGLQSGFAYVAFLVELHTGNLETSPQKPLQQLKHT